MNLLSYPGYGIYIPPPPLPVLFIITWQHQAGSATNWYSSGTQLFLCHTFADLDLFLGLP